MLTTLFLFSSQSKESLTRTPFVKNLILLAKKGDINLFASEEFADENITPCTLPPIPKSFPKGPASTWKNACTPLIEKIDTYNQVDAILVFDEHALRALTAVRVPQKPLIWVGDLTPLTKPKLSLYTSCALRLTRALFLSNPWTELQIKKACHWETCPKQTIPEIRFYSESTPISNWLEQLNTILTEKKSLLPSTIELNLRANNLPYIGKGSRRICHCIEDTGLCIKCYHLPETLPTDSPSSIKIRREIITCAHSRKKNTSCQEYDYLQTMIKDKPATLIAAFPETVDIVYLPTYGWSLIETLIVNHDGSPAQLFPDYLRAHTSNPDLYTKTLHLLTAFVHDLATHAITFYDLQNILIQERGNDTIRFRIADFEPANRQAISFFMKIPYFIRRKIWRRFYRTLAIHGIKPLT